VTIQIERFGFFPELGFDEGLSDFGIRERLHAGRSPDLDAIAGYLKDGWICVEAFDEDEVDVLASPPSPIGPMRLLTDGLWVWPNVVTHYVANYGLEVPEAFVARMKVNRWSVPEVPDADFDEIVDLLCGSTGDELGLDEILDMIEREKDV